MTQLSFPDVNVLLALVWEQHIHHVTAYNWYSIAGRPSLPVCRVTQLSFLRVLTSASIMQKDIHTNMSAWRLYDSLETSGNIHLLAEPAHLGPVLRSTTSIGTSSPKLWADAYLSAFATQAKLQLITFDVALAGRTSGSLLLTASSAR